ncbi:phosphate ABC transporter substrate-binding protein PstS family protein [Acidaminobacter sp. JC074]|uniref:phosphate ABC transporter substrate-binding protein n=1 Tax=Acidaminobacter sp. JC074 TaxID=2530199 RepID=UPI001F0D9BD0|nr:phosphate ABC transporter substrate-binding protein PstS family protein [Acidaminobacter sp. JC074]
MKKIFVLLMVAMLTLTAIGCGSSSETTKEASGSEKESVTISVVGSTSVTPAIEMIAKAYEETNSNIKVDIQGIGSTAGVNAANDGTGDIGMASRNLKEAEGDYGLTEYVLAYDGIAVVTHPSNPLTELDKETVTKIFTGEITNWSQVGGEDARIIVVSREEGSGTRGAFDDIMDLEAKNDAGDKYSLIVDDAIIADGNGAVKANIASKELSIGYVSLSYLDDSIQPLKVDGIDPTVENIVNGSYKVSRPFLLLTKGAVTPEVQAFLDYALGNEGQELVKSKWVPSK